MKTATLLLGAFLYLTASAFATTFVVWPDGSGQFPTIQAAIDAAAPGDTVALASGTFRGVGNRDLDFLGKAITVRSQTGDPDDCALDCEGSLPYPRRGFYFHSGEDQESVLEGITVRWGFAQYGGGIHCTNGSSPTIIRCCLRDNTGPYQAFGAGIYCYQSSPTIVECEFVGNVAEFGGGLFCRFSPIALRQCSFSANHATQRGGGFCCFDQSDAEVSTCVFTGNVALAAGALFCRDCAPSVDSCSFISNQGSYGGAISCQQGASPTITSCTFSANVGAIGGACSFYDDSQATLVRCGFFCNSATPAASALGGVMYAIHAAPRFRSCTLADNWSDRGGGAAYCVGAAAEFDSCTFSRNHAEWGGAMVCNSNSMISPILRQCTLFQNGAEQGGGIHAWGQVCPTLENSIIAFGTEGEAICLEDGATAALTCCDIYGNVGGDWTAGIASQLGTCGNISEDPLFCIYAHPEDPLALRIDSPCARENNQVCGQIGARPIGCEFQGVARESGRGPACRQLWSSPSPVSSVARVFCRVPEGNLPVPVRVGVYDAAGRLIGTVLDDTAPSGVLTLDWDARDDAGCPVPTGSYFLSVRMGSELLTLRIMVVR
jgi:predicted outer membrane repeat protein